uniref:C-type lectin domain-containing protein n=1 Tax=Stegastes partitus TaxID=144197 RepID=A0A3B4Z1P0_9TELE
MNVSTCCRVVFVTHKFWPAHKFSGRRAYVIVQSQFSWSVAQLYCRRHHSDLASIRSQNEKNYIQGILKETGFVNVWIGLYRDPWAFWSDNSTSTFTNWDIGQPNQRHPTQLCVKFNLVSGKWDDSNLNLYSCTA